MKSCDLLCLKQAPKPLICKCLEALRSNILFPSLADYPLTLCGTISLAKQQWTNFLSKLLSVNLFIERLHLITITLT